MQNIKIVLMVNVLLFRDFVRDPSGASAGVPGQVDRYTHRNFLMKYINHILAIR